MLEAIHVTERPSKLGEFGHAGDDHVVPFAVDALDIRGRAVQLGPMLDAILSRHAYPEPVARLLAEACVLAVLLGTSLKFEGKFILQTRTDGPVDMLVADFSTPHALRGYARFDADRLQALLAAGEGDQQTLLGNGVLALTIDQGEHTQRYQGIVQLDGVSLEEAARSYFRQSEQIPTELKLSVAKLVIPGSAEQWRAGGMLAQFLPEAPERMRLPDLPGGDGDSAAGAPVDNAWQEVQALLATIEPTELIDPTAAALPPVPRTWRAGVRRRARGRPVLLLAAEDQGDPRRLHRRGNPRQHRGRQDQRRLRVLLHHLRLRPGGIFAGDVTAPLDDGVS